MLLRHAFHAAASASATASAGSLRSSVLQQKRFVAVSGAGPECRVDAAHLLRELPATLPAERLHRRFVHSVTTHVVRWCAANLHVNTSEWRKLPHYSHLAKAVCALSSVEPAAALYLTSLDEWYDRFGDEHVDAEALAMLHSQPPAALRRLLGVDEAEAAAAAAAAQPPSSRRLASLEELAAAEQAVVVEIPERPTSLVLSYVGGAVCCYANRCPHVGLTLSDDRLGAWDPETGSIKCEAHGALFEPSTGYCTDGPCTGCSLSTVPFRIEEGHVVVNTPTVKEFLEALSYRRK